MRACAYRRLIVYERVSSYITSILSTTVNNSYYVSYTIWHQVPDNRTTATCARATHVTRVPPTPTYTTNSLRSSSLTEITTNGIT